MSIRQEDMPGYARAVAPDGHTYYGYYFRHQKTMPAPLTYKSKEEIEKEEWEENTEHCLIINDFADWNMPKDVKMIGNLDPEKIELCSGIRDRNGRLCFEGDIIYLDANSVTPFRVIREGKEFFITKENSSIKLPLEIKAGKFLIRRENE